MISIDQIKQYYPASMAENAVFQKHMFLLSRTEPDYPFLVSRCDIHNLAELKAAVEESLQAVDLRRKQKDFEHLLFHRDNSRRILHVVEFIHSL
ncbi:MAG: hypothetical protein R6U68_09245 [Desulfobacteraceae bacterium]